MTDQNYTHISILLDRSGSMTSLANDTIGGFNTFLREQKALPIGRATLSLATFASDYTLVHDFVDLQNVPELTPYTYRTHGQTALFWATKKLIDSVGAKFAAMREEERAGKVVFVVITDGEENHSHRLEAELNINTIKSMIEHQTHKYNWLFLYPANSLDTFHDRQGQSIGVSSFNTVKHAASPAGTRSLYASLNAGMSNYRAQETVDSTNYSFFDPSNNTTIKPAVEVQPIIVVDTPAPTIPGDSTPKS